MASQGDKATTQPHDSSLDSIHPSNFGHPSPALNSGGDGISFHPTPLSSMVPMNVGRSPFMQPLNVAGFEMPSPSMNGDSLHFIGRGVSPAFLPGTGGVLPGLSFSPSAFLKSPAALHNGQNSIAMSAFEELRMPPAANSQTSVDSDTCRSMLNRFRAFCNDSSPQPANSEAQIRLMQEAIFAGDKRRHDVLHDDDSTSHNKHARIDDGQKKKSGKRPPRPRPTSGNRGQMPGSGSGSSCHQCKSRRAGEKLTFCSNTLSSKLLDADGTRHHIKEGGSCRKKYCDQCLWKFYQEKPPNPEERNEWTCPSCRSVCCCAACRRSKIKQSGQSDLESRILAMSPATSLAYGLVYFGDMMDPATQFKLTGSTDYQ